jgi:hypothetical protein
MSGVPKTYDQRSAPARQAVAKAVTISERSKGLSATRPVLSLSKECQDHDGLYASRLQHDT